MLCFLLTSSVAWPSSLPQKESGAEMQKAVEEFKTMTRELGLRPGTQSRQRRNGSAKPSWHGRLFENFRNDFLDAVPHEIVQRGTTKSTLRRNQFGFNVAGPVVIPHLYDGSGATYFSLSYEGVRERVSRSYLRTIPTMPERTGDYGAVVDQAGDPLPIFDPLTTQRNPDFDPSKPVAMDNLEYLRSPFPENRIPADRLDPVAQKALAFYPLPNASVGPFFRNNYFVVSPETNTANGMIAKVDHSIRERHRVSLGMSFSNGFLGAASFFPTAADPASPDRAFHSRSGSLDYVFTKSPQTVNTFSFQASTDESQTGTDQEVDYASQIGFRGSTNLGFPIFRFSPYLSMGRAFAISKNARNTFRWSDALSARRGKHNLRLFGRYIRYQVNTFWPSYPAGSLRFGSELTGLPGIVNTGHAFASYLLGLAEFAQSSVVESPSYFRKSFTSLSLRDNYEAIRGLHLTVGLELSNNTPRTEKFDRQSNIDLDVTNPANGRPGAMVVAGRNGQGRAFQPNLLKLEPSAGVAWSPHGDPKTVVRLRYSRNYSGFPLYFGQWGTQAFNGSPAYISPNTQLAPAVTLSSGLPAPPHEFPDLRPEAANDTIADLIDSSDNQPVYQSASLSVERELPASLILRLGAAYSGGKNLLVGASTANPNAIRLEALQLRDKLNDEEFNRSLRPFPQYKGFELNGSYPLGRYQRHEFNVRLEKRASQGLTLNLSYEFSRQADDYSGPFGRQDVYNRDNEWSLTRFNHPHTFSVSYVYELPVGSSKPWLAFSDWKRYFVDGWSISGISSLRSGEPLALQPLFNNTGGVVDALRVNVVPGVDPHVSDPGPELWFNPEAFDQPPDFAIGDAARTHPSLRAPLSQNHDLAVNKRFALAADRTIEISAMGLNFLNHANWNDPDEEIGPTSAPNVNAGKIIGSRGGRVIQLGLRFSF